MRDVVQEALDDYEDPGSDVGSDEDGDIREFDEDEDDEEREERRIREVNSIANHPAPESFTNLDLSSSNPSAVFSVLQRFVNLKHLNLVRCLLTEVPAWFVLDDLLLSTSKSERSSLTSP